MAEKFLFEKGTFMRKILLAFLVIIVLLIATGSYIVNKKSATYVSSFLTQKLGTPVIVDSVSAGIRQMDVENIKIMDPAAPSEVLLEVKRISVDYQILTILNQTVVIDNIIIDRPLAYVRLYNMNGSDNNWKHFLEKINAGGSAPKETPSSPARNFLVHKLVINSLGANINHSLLGSYDVRLPARKPIVINEIDSGNALQMQQQLGLIVAAIMEALSQYKGLSALTTGIKIAGLPVEFVSGITKQLSGQSADLIESGAGVASSAINQGIDEVKDFFNGIFKK